LKTGLTLPQTYDPINCLYLALPLVLVHVHVLRVALRLQGRQEAQHWKRMKAVIDPLVQHSNTRLLLVLFHERLDMTKDSTMLSRLSFSIRAASAGPTAWTILQWSMLLALSYLASVHDAAAVDPRWLLRMRRRVCQAREVGSTAIKRRMPAEGFFFVFSSPLHPPSSGMFNHHQPPSNHPLLPCLQTVSLSLLWYSYPLSHSLSRSIRQACPLIGPSGRGRKTPGVVCPQKVTEPPRSPVS